MNYMNYSVVPTMLIFLLGISCTPRNSHKTADQSEPLQGGHTRIEDGGSLEAIVDQSEPFARIEDGGIVDFNFTKYGRLTKIKANGPILPSELASYYNFINWSWVQWSYDNNYQKTMAWKESYVMQSLAEMYKFRNKKWYLDKLIQRADRVLKNRNDFKSSPKSDYILRKVTPTWPQYNEDYTFNGKKKYFSNVVQTAMILYPIIWAAKIILEDQTIYSKLGPSGEAYYKTAKRYLNATRKTLLVFDSPQWFNSSNKLYRFPTNKYGARLLGEKNSGNILPYNRLFAIGRVLIEIANCYELLNSRDDIVDDYRHRVNKISRFFVNRLEIKGKSKKYYLWKFSSSHDKYEDISHGRIDISFLTLAFENGLTIRDFHLDRIALTFSRRIILDSDYNLSWRVSGEVDRGNEVYRNMRCGGWLDLTSWNEEIYHACAYHFERMIHDNKGIGYAKMLKWKAGVSIDPFVLIRQAGIANQL